MPEPRDILAGCLEGDCERVILIHREREISRGELAGEVSRLADGLRANLRAGDLLAIWLPNGPEILALYLACFQTGIVPMPLPPGLKWPELRRILSQARAAGLLTSATSAAAHADALSSLVGQVWVTSPEASRFPALTGSAPQTAPPCADPDRLALVLHTSGSAGSPKGVKLSSASLEHILAYRLAHTGLGADSVSVVASCVSQSVGLYQSLASLAAGATMVLLESYDVEAMAEAVARYRPTHLIMVVDAFDRLLQHPRIRAESLANICFAAAGADRLTPRLQDSFIALTGRPLCASYGLAESSWALVNHSGRIDKCLALGKPCPDVEIRLSGPDRQQVVRGEVGEIHIRSPRNMLGYLHDDAATHAALVDGWLTTGDLAWEDPEGFFWFAGRSTDLIVLATGDKVSPAEVENVLRTHPTVAACVVVGRVTAEGSQVPWAFVVKTQETSPQALRDFLREHLSDFKVPEGIEFVAELPVGLSGKILRHSLPVRHWPAC
jgi:long-chain acyl-CoA synthetase